jgi:hypothetical protein
MLSRKWWIIIAGVVIIALGLGLGLGLGLRGGGAVDLSSPTATAQSFLDAMENKDADRMADCCQFPLTYMHLDFDDRASFVDTMKAGFAVIKSIDISNLNVNVTDQNETSATVKASYHLREVLGDKTIDERDLTQTFEMQKTGDNWYIVSTWAV